MPRREPPPGACAAAVIGRNGAPGRRWASSTSEAACGAVWQRQVKQIVALAKALTGCDLESVKHFVGRSREIYFDRDVTQDDIDERLGALDRGFWEKYFCCCFASEDTRVTSIRDALLLSHGYAFVGDGAVQINFSTNLRFLGKQLRKGLHPFAALVDGTQHDAENWLVDTLTSSRTRNDLFGDVKVDPEVLAYIYLVLHRIVFEQVPDPTKNRFLFLHRFDLSAVRRLLNSTQQDAVARVDPSVVLKVASSRKRAKSLALDDRFSMAAGMNHRDVLDDHGIENTLGEFLDAVLRDRYGLVARDRMSELLLRVADSTIPATVEGADNIVFEGRLPGWARFAKSDPDQARDVKALGKSLKEGLMALGEIVLGYDCAPGEQRSRSQPRSDLRIEMGRIDLGRIDVERDSDDERWDRTRSQHEGLLVPNQDTVIDLFDF